MTSWLIPLSACTPRTPPGGEPPAVASRRPFEPMVEGELVREGIAYGPYREGHRPGGPLPSAEQIREDLGILAPRWHMIRMYGSREPTETVLREIRDGGLPIRAMIGAWIAPNDPASNDAEVEEVIRLANEYPDVVFAVSVGNETQVSWSAHRTDQPTLLAALRQVRRSVAQPVTTADDYNFWNKPESGPVAEEVDFLLLHAYAMWNGQPLDQAVSWTAEIHQSIARAHPSLPVVIGETGWATTLNPDGNEGQHIKGAAGEAEQAEFYRGFTAWAAEAGVPYFYFEAFDEPWKGSDDPREVEKHWGLFRVDRTPKAAAKDL